MANATIPGARNSIVASPSGTTTARLMTKGTEDTATSITTTPLTVWVKMRRRDASRRVRRDWTSVDATVKVASKPGPPTCSARAETARKGTLKLETMRRPDPKCRNCKDCSIMLAPVTARVVNVTQERYSPDSPDALTTSAASIIMPMVLGRKIWSAETSATRGGHFSSGS